ETLESVRPRAREEGAVHFERWVLGGRAYQDEQPALDVRKDSILLRLVETMNLVDEENRPLARHLTGAGVFRRSTQVGDAGGHATDGDHVRTRLAADHLGQGGLAAARRAPEHHRREAILLDSSAQHLAGADQVLLADKLVEHARPHSQG